MAPRNAKSDLLEMILNDLDASRRLNQRLTVNVEKLRATLMASSPARLEESDGVFDDELRPTDVLLSLEEAAKILKMDIQDLQLRCLTGTIDAVRLGDEGEWKVRQSTVDAFLSMSSRPPKT